MAIAYRTKARHLVHCRGSQHVDHAPPLFGSIFWIKLRLIRESVKQKPDIDGKGFRWLFGIGMIGLVVEVLGLIVVFNNGSAENKQAQYQPAISICVACNMENPD